MQGSGASLYSLVCSSTPLAWLAMRRAYGCHLLAIAQAGAGSQQ